MAIRRVLAATLVAVCLTTAGCGDTAATPKATASASSTTAKANPTATTSAVSKAALTAADVLTKLTGASLGVTNGAVQDESTDPNNLIGRPSGYLSRASFDLPGGAPDGKQYDIERGGVVEVWPTAEAAKKRAEYIEKIAEGMPIFGEYHYLSSGGTILLRITNKVAPSVAKPFEPVIASL